MLAFQKRLLENILLGYRMESMLNIALVILAFLTSIAALGGNSWDGDRLLLRGQISIVLLALVLAVGIIKEAHVRAEKKVLEGKLRASETMLSRLVESATPSSAQRMRVSGSLAKAGTTVSLPTMKYTQKEEHTLFEFRNRDDAMAGLILLENGELVQLSLRNDEDLSKQILANSFVDPFLRPEEGWNELSNWVVDIASAYVSPNGISFDLDPKQRSITLHEIDESKQSTGRHAYFDKQFLDSLISESRSKAGFLIAAGLKRQ
jgi:hypothetical protein